MKNPKRKLDESLAGRRRAELLHVAGKQVAGRLIYAAADRDMGQVLDALRGFHPDGNLSLILTLADTAAAALEALHGDGWRDALSLAMLDAELDGEVIDDADV